MLSLILIVWVVGGIVVLFKRGKENKPWEMIFIVWFIVLLLSAASEGVLIGTISQDNEGYYEQQIEILTEQNEVIEDMITMLEESQDAYKSQIEILESQIKENNQSIRRYEKEKSLAPLARMLVYFG